MRVVHAQLGRVRIGTHDELVGTRLGRAFLIDVELQDVGAYESAEPVETAHFRCIFDIIDRAVVEGHHAPALLKRQDELVAGADVHRLELGAGDVQRLEWQLDVCER